MTEEPTLFSAVKSQRLSLFGHVTHVDGQADMNKIIFEPPPEN